MRIDPVKMKLTYSAAGHQSFLIRASGKLKTCVGHRIERELDAGLVNELQTNPNLNEGFQRILGRTALHRLPRVAAASPGAITSRDGTGCRIRFQESRAEPDQTYVIIEISDTDAPPPSHMFVIDQVGQCSKFALPAARGGVIQFLVERDSALLSGLLDIKTEVFLK